MSRQEDVEAARKAAADIIGGCPHGRKARTACQSCREVRILRAIEAARAEDAREIERLQESYRLLATQEYEPAKAEALAQEERAEAAEPEIERLKARDGLLAAVENVVNTYGKTDGLPHDRVFVLGQRADTAEREVERLRDMLRETEEERDQADAEVESLRRERDEADVEKYHPEFGSVWGEIVEERDQLRAALGALVKFMESLRHIHDHTGAMNATQLERRDRYVAALAAAAPLLAQPAQEKTTCSCKFSDAWRCAVSQSLSTIACYCQCHRPTYHQPVQEKKEER